MKRFSVAGWRIGDRIHGMETKNKEILRSLMIDGHLSNAGLAREIGLSESATLERVRRLEKEGVIEGYSARVAPAQVDRGLEVYTTFCLKNQSVEAVTRFEEAVAEMDEVLNCVQLLGRFDFIAHIAVRDVDALQEFIVRCLLPLGASIDRMESLTVLKTLKRNHPPLPIEPN